MNKIEIKLKEKYTDKEKEMIKVLEKHIHILNDNRNKCFEYLVEHLYTMTFIIILLLLVIIILLL